MSILPLNTFASNTTQIYRSSNDTGTEGGAISIRAGQFSQNFNLGSGIGSGGPVGQFGLFDTCYTSSLKGFIKFTRKSGASSITGQLYLTSQSTGYADPSQYMTSLNVIITDGTIINLDGLKYNDTQGYGYLILGFTTTADSGSPSSWSISSWSSGSVPYASQYTNSAWTNTAGGAVVLISE